MKKRFILVVVLLLFICIMSVTIVGIATGILGVNEDNVNVISVDKNNLDKYIQHTLSKGTLEISSHLDGYVVYEENAIVIAEQKASKSNVNINIGVGQWVNKDDVLCTNGTLEMKAPVSGKIIDVVNNENIVITILDYTKSSIKVYVEEEHQSKITSSTIISGAFNGGKEIPLYIKNITPLVEEGKFSILLNNEFQVFENSKIDIKINYEVKENIMIIPEEYVSFDSNGKAYVKVLYDKDNIEKIYVSLGSKSSGFYELLKADSLEGQIVVVDKEELMIEGNK